MSVVFALVVNFGDGEQGLDAATREVQRLGHLRVRGVNAPLSGPHITKIQSSVAYTEFSVVVNGLGSGGPVPPPGLDPRSLTNEEISQAARALYDLLRSFSGYRAAIVGWNPEPLVDVNDLEAEWRKGDPPEYAGLVLAEDLCARWRLGREWTSFCDGYQWLPYAGSVNW
jgi:hypothetical protein